MIQVHCGSTRLALSATATNWLPWWGNGTSFVGFALEIDAPVPCAMDVYNVLIHLAVAPGAGTSRTFTLLKNGVATSIVITISGTNGEGQDRTHKVSCVAGDYLAMQEVPTGSPAVSQAYMSLESNTTGANATQAVLWCCTDGNPTFTRFLPCVGGVSEYQATENQTQVPSPMACTINALYTHASGAPGSGGGGYDYQLRLNGANVGGVASMRNTTQDANVTGLTQAVAVGDLLCLESIHAASANQLEIGVAILYTPGTPGQSWYGGSDVQTLASTTEYTAAAGIGAQTWQATQGVVEVLSGFTKFKVSNLYAKVQTAPGGVTAHTFTFQQGGVPGSSAVTITGAATTAQDNTHSDHVGVDTLLELVHTATGAPASSNANSWSWIQTPQGGGGGNGHGHGHGGGGSGGTAGGPLSPGQYGATGPKLF